MNFKEARNKSALKKSLGVLICLPATISTIISFLKMVYYRIDDGSRFGSAIARPFKQLVSSVYEKTQFLIWFWNNSPTPNQRDLSESSNFYFLLVYLSIFVGLALYASGKKLSARLAKISEKIENLLIEESMKGVTARNRDEIERSTEIPQSSIFSQLHQLYLAPIITALIGAALVKALGV